MYTISKHARERYAERIMDREHKADVARYVIENEEKITEDVNQMIEYGQVIYQGKQNRDGKSVMITVVLKDCWIILCDATKNLVVTLFKIDFGLDDEFTKLYISKMMDKLNAAKEKLSNEVVKIRQETQNYAILIENNKYLINNYKAKINALNDLNNAYQEVINNNSTLISVAEEEVADIINKLIGKKEF